MGALEGVAKDAAPSLLVEITLFELRRCVWEILVELFGAEGFQGVDGGGASGGKEAGSKGDDEDACEGE